MTGPGMKRPVHFPEYGVARLTALAEAGLGRKISLGGASGLLHDLDYRPTHDGDAWWTAEASAEDRQQVVAVLERTLRSWGEVRTPYALT